MHNNVALMDNAFIEFFTTRDIQMEENKAGCMEVLLNLLAMVALFLSTKVSIETSGYKLLMDMVRGHFLPLKLSSIMIEASIDLII